MGLLDLINFIFSAIYMIIFAGVILSWVEVGVQRAAWLYSPPINIIRELSFQIIRPFRNFLERIGLRTGPIDFSPIIAILAIQLFQRILISLLFGPGIR
jgi:YggT family protein